MRSGWWILGIALLSQVTESLVARIFCFTGASVEFHRSCHDRRRCSTKIPQSGRTPRPALRKMAGRAGSRARRATTAVSNFWADDDWDDPGVGDLGYSSYGPIGRDDEFDEDDEVESDEVDEDTPLSILDLEPDEDDEDDDDPALNMLGLLSKKKPWLPDSDMRYNFRGNADVNRNRLQSTRAVAGGGDVRDGEGKSVRGELERRRRTSAAVVLGVEDMIGEEAMKALSSGSPGIVDDDDVEDDLDLDDEDFDDETPLDPYASLALGHKAEEEDESIWEEEERRINAKKRGITLDAQPALAPTAPEIPITGDPDELALGLTSVIPSAVNEEDLKKAGTEAWERANEARWASLAAQALREKRLAAAKAKIAEEREMEKEALRRLKMPLTWEVDADDGGDDEEDSAAFETRWREGDPWHSDDVIAAASEATGEINAKSTRQNGADLPLPNNGVSSVAELLEVELRDLKTRRAKAEQLSEPRQNDEIVASRETGEEGGSASVASTAVSSPKRRRSKAREISSTSPDNSRKQGSSIPGETADHAPGPTAKASTLRSPAAKRTTTKAAVPADSTALLASVSDTNLPVGLEAAEQVAAAAAAAVARAGVGIDVSPGAMELPGPGKRRKRAEKAAAAAKAAGGVTGADDGAKKKIVPQKRKKAAAKESVGPAAVTSDAQSASGTDAPTVPSKQNSATMAATAVAVVEAAGSGTTVVAGVLDGAAVTEENENSGFGPQILTKKRRKSAGHAAAALENETSGGGRLSMIYTPDEQTEGEGRTSLPSVQSGDVVQDEDAPENSLSVTAVTGSNPGGRVRRNDSQTDVRTSEREIIADASLDNDDDVSAASPGDDSSDEVVEVGGVTLRRSDFEPKTVRKISLAELGELSGSGRGRRSQSAGTERRGDGSAGNRGKRTSRQEEEENMRLFIRAGLLHADGTMLDVEEGMEDEFEELEYEEGAEGYAGGAAIIGGAVMEENTPEGFAGGEEACQLLRDRLDFDEAQITHLRKNYPPLRGELWYRRDTSPTTGEKSKKYLDTFHLEDTLPDLLDHLLGDEALGGVGLGPEKVRAMLTNTPNLVGLEAKDAVCVTEYLRSVLGLKGHGEVASVLAGCPPMLMYSVKHNLQKKVKCYTTALNWSVDDIRSLLAVFPILLSIPIEGNTCGVVDFLRVEVGLQTPVVGAMVQEFPELLAVRPKRLKAVFHYLWKVLEIPRNGVAVLLSQYPRVCALEAEANLSPLRFFFERQLHLEDKAQIGRLVYKYPQLLLRDVETELNPRAEDFRKAMGLEGLEPLPPKVRNRPKRNYRPDIREDNAYRGRGGGRGPSGRGSGTPRNGRGEGRGAGGRSSSSDQGGGGRSGYYSSGHRSVAGQMGGEGYRGRGGGRYRGEGRGGRDGRVDGVRRTGGD